MSPEKRFERYVQRLSAADVLLLNRVVSRHASSLYKVMYRDKQRANQRAGNHAAAAKRQREAA